MDYLVHGWVASLSKSNEFRSCSTESNEFGRTDVTIVRTIFTEMERSELLNHFYSLPLKVFALIAGLYLTAAASPHSFIHTLQLSESLSLLRMM